MERSKVSKAVADIRPHGRISQVARSIYYPLLRALYLSQTKHPCSKMQRLRQLRLRSLQLSNNCRGRKSQFIKLLAVDMPHETSINPISISPIAAEFAKMYESRLLIHTSVLRRFIMSELCIVNLLPPEQCQRKRQRAQFRSGNDQPEPVAKHRKQECSKKATRNPPRYWNTLFKVHLTRGALREEPDLTGLREASLNGWHESLLFFLTTTSKATRRRCDSQKDYQ